MSGRQGACKRRLHFCQPQCGTQEDPAADMCEQDSGQIGSSWEGHAGQHAAVCIDKAADPVMYGHSDGSSRTAVDRCPEVLYIAATIHISGNRHDRDELPSPAGHLAAAVGPSCPASASSPCAAGPAALPAPPLQGCMKVRPATHAASSDLGRAYCRASRALPGLAPTTASLQQVRDWLTTMGA